MSTTSRPNTTPRQSSSGSSNVPAARWPSPASASADRHRRPRTPSRPVAGARVEVDQAAPGRSRAGRRAWRARRGRPPCAGPRAHRAGSPRPRAIHSTAWRTTKVDGHRRHHPIAVAGRLRRSRRGARPARSRCDGPSATRSNRRPSIEAGRSTPDQVEDRGRDVDEGDEPGAAGAPRPQQPGLDPGAAHAGHGQVDRGPRRWYGRHHQHRVAGRIDRRRAGRPRGRRSQRSACAAHLGRWAGARHAACSDRRGPGRIPPPARRHRRTRPPRRPPTTAPGAGARRTGPSGAASRSAGRTPLRRAPCPSSIDERVAAPCGWNAGPSSRPCAVGVGDGGARHAGVGQRLAEGADLGAVVEVARCGATRAGKPKASSPSGRRRPRCCARTTAPAGVPKKSSSGSSTCPSASAPRARAPALIVA